MPRSLLIPRDVSTPTRHTYDIPVLVKPYYAVQYIVLAFIGCISVTSMRGFLRNMRKVC